MSEPRQSLRSRIEQSRHELEGIRNEIQALKDEAQRVLLSEIARAEAIIAQALRDIDHPLLRRRSQTAPNPNLPFRVWFEEELRRGADYGSVADAAAAYEAAGYKFI